MSGQVPAATDARSVDAKPRRTSESTRRVRRLDWLVVSTVAAACSVGSVAFQRGFLQSWDEYAVASVARNLWFHGSLRECCNAFQAFPLDHSGYAKFGVGMSLVMAPLWGLNGSASPSHAIWLTLSGPLLLAGAAAAIARTGVVLNWRRSTVVITTLAFAFATMAAFYSATTFSEPGVTLGTAIALLGFATWNVRGSRSGPWLLGGGVALAALFRPDSFLLVGIMIPGVLLFTRPGVLARTWSRWIPGVVTPLVVVAAWTLVYNVVRFGSAFNFGYGGPYDTRGFSTPLLHGVALQLVSPGKSFFLYSPILVAALPGLIWLWLKHGAVAVVIIGLCVARVCFYARWWTPIGGASWGPRFLLPLCALLAIPLGAAIDHVRELAGARRLVATASFIALGAISIAVQVLALSTNYKITEHAAIDSGGIPAALVAKVVSERTHDLNWTWGGSPLRRALPLAQHEPSVLHWFGHGRWLTGTALLLAAAFLVGIASVAALRADRRARI
jgi:hypothetical protein